jgi:CBS domain-containing protein
MPHVSDIMSTDVQVIQPHETLRRAAMLMQEFDVGVLPVCDGLRLRGMLTDRDITIYGVAEGLDPDSSCVSDVMTEGVEFCTTGQDTEDIMRLMGASQLRRLPVVDGDHNLVGIVSLGDLAVRQGGHIDEVVREVSRPDVERSAAGLGQDSGGGE